MLETILKLYVMYMALDVRSPVPHLFGPPGCGKSTVVEQLAELVGKKLYVINVSRISPLEVEGVQMPVSGDDGQMKLKLLHATFWTQLEDGDVLLLDEFLRGFPEVYNALLDILTGRVVGGFKLPKVFIIAASNSTVTYDKALEDRLMHLPVPDPRKRKSEKTKLARLIVDQLGLMPQMADSMEMQSLLDTEVLPMFEVLDSLKNRSSSPAALKGSSVRKLIGQAQLREIESPALQTMLDANNRMAMSAGKPQFVFLTNGRPTHLPAKYVEKATKLRGNSHLTSLQATNLELNFQLIEMESIRNEKGVADDHVDDESDVFV